ncbi:Hypothetical protein GbCGDNIH2_1222 [Granulibacter bethesdensis]|nr:Hypothetical protein GbCGDNIH2_1222 [Granulibacter bethesdensis]
MACGRDRRQFEEGTNTREGPAKHASSSPAARLTIFPSGIVNKPRSDSLINK